MAYLNGPFSPLPRVWCRRPNTTTTTSVCPLLKHTETKISSVTVSGWTKVLAVLQIATKFRSPLNHLNQIFSCAIELW